MYPVRHVIPPFDVVEHDEDDGCPCEPEREVWVVAGKETWVYFHSALLEDLSVAWGRDLPTVQVKNRVQR